MLPPPAPVAQGGGPSLLIRLPSELLLTIMEASSPSLETYLQLLSLCRATRTAIRGTPRELSFFLCNNDDDNDAYEGDVTDPLMAQVIAPSPDALAALVGPCKGLVKLTLPRGNVMLLGRSPANAPWVSEAFEGHSRLAVLSVPSADAYMPFLPGIVGLLPGLEELHMGGPDQITTMTRHSIRGSSWAAHLFSKADELLAALGRSRPPLLRVLRHSLRPIAQLRLLNCGGISEDLADVGLCRLESVQLSLRCDSAAEVATLGRLLGANRDTLRTVILEAVAGGAAARPRGVGPISLAGLFDPLNGLPHLDDLTVILTEEYRLENTLPDPDAVLGCLTPGLLDRLAHLSVHLCYGKPEFNNRCPTAPIRIAARRLRTLCFNVGYMILSSTILELACPCLEALALPEYVKRYKQAFLGGLVMDCPQLRSIEGFPGERCQCQATAMPHLARLRVLRGTASLGALLPLLDLAPGLRDLSPTIAVTQAAHLARLLASDTLTRLSLSANRDVVGRILRLPAQLERLELSLSTHPNELVVDAPGLRSLSLTDDDAWQKSELRVALRCPALLALKLDVSRLTHLGLADPGGPVPPLVHLILHVEPHSRYMSDIREMEEATQDEPFMEDVAGTLELLGARLRCLCLRGTFPAWPQLAAALGRLPRLAELALFRLTAPGDLVLACPALQRLTLSDTRFRSVVFDCPRLEVLVMCFIPGCLERFEPAGGHTPPNLCCVRMQPDLNERFPWLASVPGIDHGWYHACESGARQNTAASESEHPGNVPS
ncbi:hypothetical protein PAPYR_6049 [Paratrimastix pyriformis]|uniref:F-box domain-containing protein n=1 Tax=Paratrimastix pyriformis TaxID=342808 RepID=A0ABQ8UG53_9EUKA|nr:hypothetical protein PAPYR_6049 [Paratrimastix pyriformis]